MNEKYMKIALKEAEKAFSNEEVPIGAVIVKNGKVISRAYNLRETKKQACAHAEILAIQKACKKLNAWRLEGCDLYVTLEPCPMCAGAIMNSRIKNVYIGAKEPRSGAVGSKINLFEDAVYNHKVNYQIGIFEEESMKLMKTFFKKRRKEKREKHDFA